MAHYTKTDIWKFRVSKLTALRPWPICSTRAICHNSKFPRAVALQVARKLCEILKPATSRLIVAGSLRRRKMEVGDLEILYVPRFGLAKGDDLFETEKNLADLAIEDLQRRYLLKRRLNVNGSETFGPRNKLMVHGLSGLPVDLFEATEENWWNYLVCRTGPAESNTRIASLALERGWRWKPYNRGFVRLEDSAETDEWHVVRSERDVFEFVGLPWKEPWER